MCKGKRRVPWFFNFPTEFLGHSLLKFMVSIIEAFDVKAESGEVT